VGGALSTQSLIGEKAVYVARAGVAIAHLGAEKVPPTPTRPLKGGGSDSPRRHVLTCGALASRR